MINDAMQYTAIIIVLLIILVAGTLGFLQKGDDVRKDDWYSTCTLGPILKAERW